MASCLLGWIEQSLVSLSRTAGFLLYAAPGGMFLDCDRFTLILWAWLTITPGCPLCGCVFVVCECMVDSVTWALNDKFGAVWNANVACESDSLSYPQLLPSLEGHSTVCLPPIGPLIPSPFKDVVKAQMAGC